MSNEKIKVVVLGLGRAGWDIHINRIQDDERYQVVAVSDGLEERLEEAKKQFNCATYLDSVELLENEKADLAIVATPSHTHVDLGILAAEKGFDLVMEKPISNTIEEAKTLVDGVKKLGKKMFVHQSYRFVPAFSFLRHAIENNLIGKVFEIRCHAFSFSRRNDWQTLSKYNGGVLYNTGSHYLDFLLNLTDSDFDITFADRKLICDAGDTEDHVKVILKEKEGLVVDFELSTSCAMASKKLFTLLGTCGTMEGDADNFSIKRFDPTKVEKLEVRENVAVAGRSYDNGDRLPWIEEEIETKNYREGDFYDNVYDVLKNGGEMEVTPESVVKLMDVMYQIKQKTEIQDLRTAKV